MANLVDERAKARIAARIVSAEFGNFGGWRTVGEGVCEMRIDFGPGYRVYYMRRGGLVYLLLIGGDKKNQAKDIRKSKLMASRIRKALI